MPILDTLPPNSPTSNALPTETVDYPDQEDELRAQGYQFVDGKGLLKAEKRYRILVLADKVGKVPILGGTLIGPARIALGLAAMILAGIAALFLMLCGRCDLTGKCGFTFARACGEAVRGFTELIPFFVNYLDHKREENEEHGTIYDAGGAYGEFYYLTPPDSGFICYSKRKFDGEVQWSPRFENGGSSGGIVGITGQVLNYNRTTE